MAVGEGTRTRVEARDDHTEVATIRGSNPTVVAAAGKQAAATRTHMTGLPELPPEVDDAAPGMQHG